MKRTIPEEQKLKKDIEEMKQLTLDFPFGLVPEELDTSDYFRRVRQVNENESSRSKTSIENKRKRSGDQGLR